jgi:CheY-like chemotaxis protein
VPDLKEESARKHRKSRAERGESETLKILVVDDAKLMRLTLGNINRKMGHEVIEAENGKDALSSTGRISPTW